MPAYDTPEPITVSLEIGVGDIRIAASERADTIVEVRPSDPASEGDVTAAGQTRVEFADGRLSVKGPKGLRHSPPWGGHKSIDVEIAVPTGSRLDAEVGAAALSSSGRLGELRYRSGAGAIRLEQTGPVQIRTGAGDISVEHVAGRAEIRTGSGAIELGGVDGRAVVKNANGDTWIGDVTGEVRVSAANGKIAVDRPRNVVHAKTANGDVLLGAVARGEVVAETGFGKVDVGVVDGVAAWLELHTGFGNVSNALDPADRPQQGEEAVEIRARSGYGDITIHRAVVNEHAGARS